MKLRILLIVSSLIALSHTATVNLVKRESSSLAASNYQSIRDRNEELFKDEKFVFGTQIKDDKEPTIFTGDVMKAKTIQNQIKNTKGKGKFGYSLGTENGIEIEQIGKLKADNKTLVVSGSYSYTGANGKRYRVRYTADEFGYHPKTELIVDIPNLEGNTATKPTLKPFSFSGYDKMRELANKNKVQQSPGYTSNVGNNNGNGPTSSLEGVQGYEYPIQNANLDSLDKLGNLDNLDNLNKKPVEDRMYLPPITEENKKIVEDRHYLPPMDYLPPTTSDLNVDYLPPTES